MADKSWDISMGVHKTERILDALGKGPLSLDYLKLDEESMQRHFTPWEREYYTLKSGEEIVTIRSAVNRELMYVVNVTGDNALTAIAEVWALIGKKF